MTADLFALIARLEAAEVGSRELDVAIARSLGWGVHNARRFGLWVVPFGEYDTCDPDDMFELGEFTTSLDAALALAERVLGNGPCVLHRNGPNEWGFTYVDDDTAYATTPALSVCAAILRAKQGEG